MSEDRRANRPHHDGSALYVSNSTPELGDSVAVRVRVPVGYGPLHAVRVRSNPDHEPLWSEATLVSSDVDGWDWWQADVVVANPRHGYRWVFIHADDEGRPAGAEWLNQSGLSRIEQLDGEDFALLAYDAPPEWLSSSVLYQVFPDRFARSAAADERPVPEWAIAADWSDPVDPVVPGRSQQYYGGDLDGVRERLGHLVSLGVNLLYLTPVFPAASNHRYDAASFAEVDELLGGDEALIRLVEEAHARGIRVIGDLTSNHSGHLHEWFRAAFGSPDAPEGDFYYFSNDAHTEYECWMGAVTLPKFNWKSAELRRRFIEGPDSIVGRWLQAPYSLDGWRIDVANMTGRLHDEDLNESVRQQIRRTMVEVNPDTILLGESTNDAASDFQGDAWHGAMTYTCFTRPLWGWLSEPTHAPRLDWDGSTTTEPWYFTQPIGGIPKLDAREFVAQHQRFTAAYPWRVRLGTMNALDTHDTARFASNAAPGTVPLALGLSVTLPGIPVVFAGDEFGLTGGDGEESRTPIPWGSESEPAVRHVLDTYRATIGLRRDHPVLDTGGMRWIAVADQAVAFVRESVDETLLIVAGRGSLDLEWATDAVGGPITVASRLLGEAELVERDGVWAAVSADSTFTVWSLPGASAPAWGA
ncbi:glycoside hydrolase family 13 protein [Agromyces atrinae]|uniref:Alpha-glucosidase n=1 Tax=Agromyces atrinae TaxID=592376 RepID=A0A4Q2M6A6_9MICO|nr:glycoside hydrolase family 13 protein [Agromyces atrinae]NYD67334.1 alpha-glucosidase [Agromyces atrinae]RXZ86837.1 glycoside hydrolase family 13 protein [Agromyces atrinae]